MIAAIIQAPIFVSWSIKQPLPPISSYCHLIGFLKHKSDHVSIIKFLKWLYCLQANIHIFQRDLKVLHWSGTNLPAPSFPIISQLHSLLLKYIMLLCICSCCSLWINTKPTFFLLFLFQVLVQALLLQNISLIYLRRVRDILLFVFPQNLKFTAFTQLPLCCVCFPICNTSILVFVKLCLFY